MIPANSSRRIWELDFMRGLAILLMVIFHFIYDLHEFYKIPIEYEQGFVYYIGKAAASLFILLAGTSCYLSSNNFKRGVKLVLLGLMITIVTSIAVPGSNIIFGILHFLGVSILLFPLVKGFKPLPLAAWGTSVIIAGFYIKGVNMPNNYFAPLGLLSDDFYSADYYPLFPWFGLFLYGVVLGKMVYKQRKSFFNFTLSQNLLSASGRHSLAIYLLHQPIMLLLLFIYFKL